MEKWLLGFLWKDVKVFGADRQAVVMSFIVPVLIASILGWLDSSASDTANAPKIPILYVDEDQSAISKGFLNRLENDSAVAVTTVKRDVAESEVREGSVSVAVIVPKGFGTKAEAALTGGSKPPLTILSDPSKPIDAEIVTGKAMQEASGAAAEAVYGALAAGASAPITIDDQYAGTKHADWSRAAHDYAGFGLQGLLFFAMESAVGLSRERRQGIWKRLGSAPVPSWMFVFSRGLSSAVLAFGIVLMIFAVGAALFGIRITGSAPGFLLLALTTALMCSTFGLLFATFGKSETQNRGVGILVILVMLATGGAWFPMDKMPAWVQSAANYLPVRWAVEGFDAVTWRGLGFSAAGRASAALLGFALIFGVLAVLRFRTLRDPS